MEQDGKGIRGPSGMVDGVDKSKRRGMEQNGLDGSGVGGAGRITEEKREWGRVAWLRVGVEWSRV